MTPPAIVLSKYEDTDFPAIADLWVAAWNASGFAIDFEARRDWLQTHLTGSLTRSAGS